MHSEKATKYFKISTVDFSYIHMPVKSRVEISQIVVAFSESMNCTKMFKFSVLHDFGFGKVSPAKQL